MPGLELPPCDHENGWWPCGADPAKCTQPEYFDYLAPRIVVARETPVTLRPHHKPLTKAIEDALADPAVQRSVNWMMTHPPGARPPDAILEPRLGHGACDIDPATGLHRAWCVACVADVDEP